MRSCSTTPSNMGSRRSGFLKWSAARKKPPSRDGPAWGVGRGCAAEGSGRDAKGRNGPSPQRLPGPQPIRHGRISKFAHGLPGRGRSRSEPGRFLPMCRARCIQAISGQCGKLRPFRRCGHGRLMPFRHSGHRQCRSGAADIRNSSGPCAPPACLRLARSIRLSDFDPRSGPCAPGCSRRPHPG